MRETEQRRQAVREAAERRGLTVEPHGRNAWRIHGKGVEVITSDLAAVDMHELRPPKPGKPWRITGQNVNILCADLATVEPKELRPFKAGVWQSRRNHFGR